MQARFRHLLLVTAFIAIYFTFPGIGPVMAQDPADGPDYQEIFGSDYTWAENLLEINSWWADTLLAHGLDPDFALSVIFPELIRYSTILDYIEIKALEVLYVQYGEDYADFSIGYFQMKPSFAKKIEEDIIRYRLEEDYTELAYLKSDTIDDPPHRAARIGRLKDEYCQLLYLEAFIRIMDLQYYDFLMRMSPAMKLQFYSTAYNTGYFKDLAVIRDEMGKRRFYCGLSEPTVKYSYAEVSKSYYDSISHKTGIPSRTY